MFAWQWHITYQNQASIHKIGGFIDSVVLPKIAFLKNRSQTFPVAIITHPPRRGLFSSNDRTQ